MKMNITRALSELKLLNDRINRKISDSSLVTACKKSARRVDGIRTPDEFCRDARADYQSIVDLIERRKVIKSAIVDSNAKTKVTIGGNRMTVAEAIERKDSIIYEQRLLAQLEIQYNNAMSRLSAKNEEVEKNLNVLLNTSFGKEGRQKVSEDEIEVISKPYREQNEWHILNPIDIQGKIKKLKDEIESFLTEVDYVLSESNAITKIEIPN